MLNKLKTGKFVNNLATTEEVNAFVQEATRMVNTYGWQERTVCPWSVPEKVTKTIAYISDFSHCTFSSKQMLITLANGLVHTLNAWEKTELEGVKVRIVKTGKVLTLDKEAAELYFELGLAEAV